MAKKTKKTTWRNSVQEAMYQATLREARRRYNTEKPVFNYRWEHVEAVAQLAVNLARLTGADEEIVEAAAWLHDIRKDKKQDHPRAGAKFAREFLPTTDFPPEKIERVAVAIEDHMGLWRDEPLQNLESAVLWDADKLAKIGLTAAVHWMGMGFAAGRRRTTLDILHDGTAVDWHEKTVASMHTAPARRAAIARLVAYDQLWSALESELYGEDLLLHAVHGEHGEGHHLDVVLVETDNGTMDDDQVLEPLESMVEDLSSRDGGA